MAETLRFVDSGRLDSSTEPQADEQALKISASTSLLMYDDPWLRVLELTNRSPVSPSVAR